MRIIFFGSGAFGVPTLERLADKHDLLAVVSQPDRRAGRGSKTAPTPVSAWVQANRPEVPLYRPESINEPEWTDRVRAHEADAWVIIAYGQKLSPQLLDSRFAINLHASLLPRWRGAAPINAAILAGDTETGNSVITLADRMDAGLVLGQSRRLIDPDLTAGELHDLLATDGPALVETVLTQHADNTLEPVEQDEASVTIAPKLGRRDAWVDFNDSAGTVRSRIHGLTPWPGVSVAIGPTETRLLRVKAETPDDESVAGHAAPGTVIDPDAGLVQCGEGTVIRLIEVQPAGKRPMSWSAFVNGRPVAPGAVIKPTRSRP